MELDKFHVDEFRAGVIGEGVSVAGAFPGIAGDLERSADAAGGEHYGFGVEELEAAFFTIVGEGSSRSGRHRGAGSGSWFPCGNRCPDGCRDPEGCGSFLSRCDRLRGRGADNDGLRNCAGGCGRLWCASNTAPQASSSWTREGASLAWSSAMRQLLRYWPPRMVSAKWTRQLSRSSTLPMAAAIPPSAITVWALPRSDFETTPTLTPAAEASMAARRPAPPAPTISTSNSCF